MVTGRKPQPTALKVIKGERADRIPSEPPRPKGELTRPGWLSPEAKREWSRLAPQLQRWGLAVTDRAAFAMLCQEWARYVACQKVLDEHGSTYTTPTGFLKPRPEARLASSHLDAVRKLCAEFGLTLSSRGRISLPGEADGDDRERYLSGS